MKKLFALLLSACILCSTAACSSNDAGSSSAATEQTTAAPTEQPTEASAQIIADDAAVKEALEELDDMEFWGVVYAERDGKPFASYANGTLFNDEPITVDTPMPLGSVSKQFCAAAILLLQEQGKLSVNDTLDKYFPEYEAGKNITLHNMLSMRSGIPSPNESTPMNDISFDKTDEENTGAFLNWLYSQPINFEPDESFEYSNSNFILLGNIVEQVSGKVYIDFMRENFFEPLGMNHTGSLFELKDSPDWAKGFRYENSELSPGIEPGTSKGAGDLVSNAADMTVWMKALSSGKVISEESYKAMTTEYSGTHYGYGIYAELGDGVGHFGSIGHFTACDYINEDKNLTLFMASATGGSTTMTNQLYSMLSVLQE